MVGAKVIGKRKKCLGLDDVMVWWRCDKCDNYLLFTLLRSS